MFLGNSFRLSYLSLEFSNNSTAGSSRKTESQISNKKRSRSMVLFVHHIHQQWLPLSSPAWSTNRSPVFGSIPTDSTPLAGTLHHRLQSRKMASHGDEMDKIEWKTMIWSEAFEKGKTCLTKSQLKNQAHKKNKREQSWTYLSFKSP